MSYLDEIINPKLDPIILHKRMLEENLKFQNEKLKQNLTEDPTLTDKILSHLSRSAIDDKVAAKIPVGSSLEKSLSAIDKEDPRRLMFEKLQQDMPGIISSVPYGTDPRMSILKAVQDRGEVIKPDVYKFIQNNSGMFGKSRIAPAEGYAEWAEKNPSMKSPLTYITEGIGTQLAGMALASPAVGTVLGHLPEVTIAGKTIGLRTGLAMLGRGLTMAPPVGTPGLLAKIVGGGLMAATALGGIDAIKTSAAKAGHPLNLLEELAVGLPVYGGLSKVAETVAGRVAGKLAMQKLSQKGESFIKDATMGDNFVTKEGGLDLAGRDSLNVFKQEQGVAKTTAEKVAQEAELEKFRELTVQDKEDIFKAGGDEAKIAGIKKARFDANVAEDAKQQKVLAEATDKEVVNRARMMREGNATLDTDTSLENARRLVKPTAEETQADFDFLRKETSLLPKSIDQMTVTEAAENVQNWKKFGLNNFNQRLPAVAEEVSATGVPAVRQTTPWKLEENFFGRSTEEITQGATANNQATIGRVKENIAYSKYLQDNLEPQVITKLAGNEKNIVAGNKITSVLTEKAVRQERVTAFENGANSILENTKAEFAKLGEDTSVQAKSKLQTIAATATTALANHIESSGFSLSARTPILQKQLSDMVRGATEPFIKAVDELAVKNNSSMVKDLIPSNSPQAIVDKFGVDSLLKQKKAEWSSITGGTGKVDLSNPVQVKDVIDWKSRWDKVKAFGIPALVATASLVPLSTLLSPDSAEASTLGAVTETTAKMIKESGSPVEQAVKDWIAAGHSSPVLSEDGLGFSHIMVGKSYAPTDAKLFPRTKVMSILDKILSPHTRGEIHFDIRDSAGRKLGHNPSVELADRSQVVNANTEAGMKIVNNIMEKYGIEDNIQQIADDMKPLVDKYHQQINLDLPYYSGRVEMLDKVLTGKFRHDAEPAMSKLSKELRYVGRDISKLDEEDKLFFDSIKQDRADAQQKILALKPVQEQFNQEHEALMKQIAQKYGTSRVALAVDGTGMQEGNTWLASMLSPEEKEAAQKIKELYQAIGVRMQDTGHDVITGPYMHHPAHPSVNFSADIKHLDGMSNDGGEAMRLVNFFTRSSNSKLMMPDTTYVMAKYLPDAFKRIEVSDFWKVGEKGGWDAIKKQMSAMRGYDGALKMLDDVRTAFDPQDVGPIGQWLNRYTSFEVARLLTLSPSVSFKHALKLMGNFSLFPAGVSAEALGHSTGIVTRQLAQATAGTSFTGKDMLADLSKAYTNQSHIYAAVSDMAPYDLPLNVYDRWITKINQAGSIAVNAVEHFDRGQTFASALLMAQKKGMTPDQARYALMDTVLKVNFLTGPNNPSWLKNPLIRTMMMFQGTPFKILEQRAMLAYNAGKDVKHLVDTLSKLRGEVKEGENLFKWNLLKDELTRSKDIYGTPYSSQFLKQMVTIGAVVGTGKMVFDADLWGHVIHIPGVQLKEKGMNLGVNPLVSASYKTFTGANKTTDNEDEFWTSRFFQTYLKNTGFPAIAHKIARLNDNDIPAMYKDSKLSYLFGVPKRKEE